MHKQFEDALFVFRRQTTAQRALSVLGHGATYIGLTLCSPVLWLLPVVSAGGALVASQAVIYLLARHAGLTVNAQGAAILTVLVFGASGALGTFAVQFARRRGARVLATASGRKARRVVASLGAAGVVDARRRDVAKQVRALAPDGLDAVLALAGGEALPPRLVDLRERTKTRLARCEAVS